MEKNPIRFAQTGKLVFVSLIFCLCSASFLRRNVVENKVQNVIEVLEGDNREQGNQYLGKGLKQKEISFACFVKCVEKFLV